MSTNELPHQSSTEEELLALYRPSFAETIPSADCDAGYLYWGTGRSIGELAICRGYDQYQDMQFEGLRNKMGEDFLFTEIHYGDDAFSGTWSPMVKLEAAPTGMNTGETMNWLLEKTIDLAETRLNWLMSAPERLKSAPSHSWMLDLAKEDLEYLEQLRANGFSNERTLSFKKIMQSKSQKTE